MRVHLLLLLLLFAFPAAAQELFPRISVTAGGYLGNFSTDVRIDAEAGSTTGTELNIERDLGLESSKTLQRFTAQWRPASRLELAGSYVSASRSGFEQIDREFRFQDNVYPVQADVATAFDTKYWDATLTVWAHKSDRAGVGITLGAAMLSIDASVAATARGQSATLTNQASTDVPVALGGAQIRYAFTPRLIGEASAGILPRVTIDQYSGRATNASARLEYRFLRAIGIGLGYNYFKLDGSVADPSLRGRLALQVDGVEGFVRIGY
ncbi:MAG TPA: hypothetical protein VJ276_11115 [Thermoanaerobaculia bacterium]|nr:hypothetical protein [Thermoanaerobaculia bacterium]